MGKFLIFLFLNTSAFRATMNFNESYMSCTMLNVMYIFSIIELFFNIIISLVSHRIHLSFMKIENTVSYHSSKQQKIETNRVRIYITIFKMMYFIFILCSPITHLEITTELYLLIILVIESRQGYRALKYSNYRYNYYMYTSRFRDYRHIFIH